MRRTTQLLLPALLSGGVTLAAQPAPKPAVVVSPPPPISSPLPTDARALFSRVVSSMGGTERVGRVKAFREKATVQAKLPTGEQTIEVESWASVDPPDRQRQTLQAAGHTLMRVVTPEGAFLSTPEGIQEMPEPLRATARRELKMSAIALAQKANDPRLTLSLGGKTPIGDVQTTLLIVKFDGDTVSWYVDPATGRTLRRVSRSGASEQRTDYSDFRLVDEMNVAFKRVISVGAEESASVVLHEYEVNPRLDPKLFARPTK